MTTKEFLEGDFVATYQGQLVTHKEALRERLGCNYLEKKEYYSNDSETTPLHWPSARNWLFQIILFLFLRVNHQEEIKDNKNLSIGVSNHYLQKTCLKLLSTKNRFVFFLRRRCHAGKTLEREKREDSGCEDRQG